MRNESNSSYEEESPSSPSPSSSSSSVSDGVVISYRVRFWIILPLYIPSLVCSLFVLYHYIANRILRHALHNHVIVILVSINLIVQLTSIPWYLSYYHLGYVWPQSPIFCMIWIVIDEGLHTTITCFFAWATIERHILIFHDRLVSTKRKTILYHYIPILLIILYGVCYIIIVIIFPPCENIYDYSQPVCGHPLCYYESRLVTVWDVVIDQVIPVTIIMSCSIGLLLRILHQKVQMHQPIRWRNYRKMIIQLLSISLLYLVLYTPQIIVEFLHLCGLPEDVGAEFMVYCEFLVDCSYLILPFVCAGSMPELRTKLKKIIPRRRRRMMAIHPQAVAMTHHRVV